MSTFESFPINFSYKGEQHSIDAQTLFISQANFLSVLNQISLTIDPDIKLDVRIEATKKGSFELHQLIELSSAVGLFSTPYTVHIEKIFSILSSYLDLKEFLNGEKAKKITKSKKRDTVKVYGNGSNSPITVNNITIKLFTNNASIDSSLLRVGETLLSDSSIDGVEVKRKGKQKKLLKLDKKEFKKLSTPNAYMEKSNKKNEKEIQARLTVRKPEIDPKPKKNSSWSVVFRSREINVIVKDQDFLDEVRTKPIRFGNGDALDVTLKIIYKYDEKEEINIEDAYHVIKVHKLIPKK